MIIDMPPGTGDIHLTLVQTVPLTGAIVVTTPQAVATADAKKALSMYTMPTVNVPVIGVVENMAYFTPAELPQNKYYIFGKEGGKNLAQEYSVPFLGEIPIVQSIREGGDNGTPAALDQNSVTGEAFHELAQNAARYIAIRNATIEPTKKVEIVT
jgi:ATP-binding protein involved in chromosome partitioning